MPDDPVPADHGLRRRQFLAAGGALVAGGALATQLGTGPARAGLPTAPRGGWYSPHREPLRPTRLTRLPPGAVSPRGWVRGQLDLQRDGLNGRLDEISDYLRMDTCGWVHPDQPGWEELPYWLRGFSDLGLVTGDERITGLSRTWIDGILATQQPDGFFGPTALRTSLEGGPDFWPSMPLVDTLRSYADATGDERIVPFLTAFFGYLGGQDDAVFGRGWGAYRWADTIDSLYWLYDRTGDATLLDLVRRIHAHSADYVTGIPTWHNVNLAQGIREPAAYWLLSGDEAHRQATYRAYDTVMTRYGQFSGGGFAGDENARPGFGDPRQGFETCGIVELMRTCEMMTRYTGDPVWADRCEELAHNLLPAAFDPQQRSTHYITSANSVALENAAKHPQFDNDFPMQAYRPGIHRYRCCPHNYGQGWPYFTEEMWLATDGGGLCASLYGPCSVTAKVGAAGTEVRVVEDTDYPFGETVRFRLSLPAATDFPLWLRIPAWCARPEVRVNGAPVGDPRPGRYLVLDRTWQDRDTVTLALPMTVQLRTWQANADSVSVRHGPLSYSLAIGERYTSYTDDTDWPHLEVEPTTAWNLGLDVDPADPAGQFEVVREPGPVPANPFTHDAVPVSLRTTARAVPAWTTDDRNVVRHLQPSPVRSTEPARPATLVPMGAARLRITSFPLIARDGGGHEWERPSASYVNGTDLLDAVNDGLEPASSYDQDMPRLTFWDHTGTTEWVQYDYAAPVTTSSAAVYWYDDTGNGGCRVPASWRLLARSGDSWVPVEGASGYPTATDAWNRVTFDPVRTTGIRLEVTLRSGFSGGILEWRVDQQG